MLRPPRAEQLEHDALVERAGELASGQPVAAICAGGYRSSLATSILEQKGFRKI